MPGIADQQVAPEAARMRRDHDAIGNDANVVAVLRTETTRPA